MSTAHAPTPAVLIVEDEAPMRKFLRDFLAGYGYRLSEAPTGQLALHMAAQNPPDVVILDLGLPDMDGQDVIRELREWFKAPIIVLSIRDQDLQRITALDNGADDYLTKPFSSGELLARIRAILRRGSNGQSQSEAPVFQVGHLRVDLATRRVSLKDEEVKLTPIEYKLLTTLVRHSGRVLTHDYLLKEVWGPRRAENTPHLRVFMAGLRRKIEIDPARPRHLLTEQGVGYRLVTD
jgi:two-component system KDP operon response regulator KdpE